MDDLKDQEADVMRAAADDLRTHALTLPTESSVRDHLLKMSTGYAIASFTAIGERLRIVAGEEA